MEVRPHRLSAALNALDTATLAWLADGDFRILVPLRGATGALNGIIALGEKRSELPYSARDRRMLTAVGATGGVWLDSRGSDPGEPQPGGKGPEDFAARECRVCGRISDAPGALCTCGGELRMLNVPRLLAGKFEIERRIGAGGMGVVYRATDTALGRSVAVKALHGRHPRDAWRLRREARAMALITHPNLATVFGLEFWFARPFLVVEYVAGGTLADRLRKGSLPEREVAIMGTSLARVLGTLHASGLLHRDVKPANIGFTQEGVVKLLDFGLARPLTDAGGSALEVAPTAPGTPDSWRTRTHGGHVVGTPLYMSPEALAGHAPDVTFDLWSLAVSLFEATAGVNPVREAGIHRAAGDETRTRLAPVLNWRQRRRGGLLPSRAVAAETGQAGKRPVVRGPHRAMLSLRADWSPGTSRPWPSCGFTHATRQQRARRSHGSEKCKCGSDTHVERCREGVCGDGIFHRDRPAAGNG